MIRFCFPSFIMGWTNLKQRKKLSYVNLKAAQAELIWKTQIRFHSTNKKNKLFSILPSILKLTWFN